MDTVCREKRSKIMSAIHSRDTLPEMRVRKMLWANGYRFRVCDKRITGHPDIGARKGVGCGWLEPNRRVGVRPEDGEGTRKDLRLHPPPPRKMGEVARRKDDVRVGFSSCADAAHLPRSDWYGGTANAIAQKRGGRVSAQAVGGAAGWNPLAIRSKHSPIIGISGTAAFPLPRRVIF